jgi:hypothetical protein
MDLCPNFGIELNGFLAQFNGAAFLRAWGYRQPSVDSITFIVTSKFQYQLISME